MFADAQLLPGLFDPELWDQALLVLLALAVGAVGGLVAPRLLGAVLGRARRSAPSTPWWDGSRSDPGKPAASASPADSRPGNGPAPARRNGVTVPAGQASEKRRSARRQGKAVRVYISGFLGRSVPAIATVVNRSRGGLGIVVDQAVSPGMAFQVRPVRAPEDTPWVCVQVRSCRPSGKRWYLGCQFTENLPWTTVLLFG